MEDKPKVEARGERRDRVFFAVVLMAFGLVALLPNFLSVSENVGLLFPLAFGLAFLVYGLVARRYGFTVPGCIITGLGVGLLIAESRPDVSGTAEGGIIVLGLGAGFIGVVVMNVLFHEKTFWWPLVPGLILGVVGVLLTIDTRASMDLLEQIGRYWPVVLLIIGVWMLVRPHEEQRT